jgi:hypothetical protein
MLGFAAYAILLAGVVWLVARTLARTPDDYRLLGLAAGVAAFLFTCVAGHPLLVSEVAYSFWIAAGLLLALSSPVRLGGASSGMTWKGAALAAQSILLLESRYRFGRASLSPRGAHASHRWLARVGKGRDGRYRGGPSDTSVFVEGNPAGPTSRCGHRWRTLENRR